MPRIWRATRFASARTGAVLIVACAGVRSGAMCRRYAGPIAKDVLERQIKSLL